jgi:hypothetical protein
MTIGGLRIGELISWLLIHNTRNHKWLQHYHQSPHFKNHSIEKVLGRNSFGTIKQAVERHGIEPAVCRWISAMLESRHIRATLSAETLGATTARGCPQGGVLSPLLLSLVVDELLWGLNNNCYYIVGYANDIAILINGKFPQTVSEVLKTALCTVQQWCERTKLSINPNKTLLPCNKEET